MKTFIVIQFEQTSDGEKCRVDRLYTTRSRASRRKRMCEKHSTEDKTFHVITKKLRGKIKCGQH